MSKYIKREKLGKDFIYDMNISTSKDDFSPLILNENGGIEEGMFLDLYLIFSHLEKESINILPFLRRCFHLLGENCTNEEMMNLFGSSVPIVKKEDSESFSSMLGFEKNKTYSEVLNHVLSDDTLDLFNIETVEKIRLIIKENQGNAKNEFSLSFPLRDIDKNPLSPLVEVLAGIKSSDTVDTFLAEKETKEDTSSKDALGAFLSQINSSQIKGELVVSFRGDS